MDDLIKLTEVACGLIVRDGLVLLAKKPRNKFFAGLWEFPGGKREAQELIAECLVRELREELGIEIEVQESMSARELELDGKPFRFVPMFCKIIAGEPLALEHEALAWVPFGEVLRYELIDVDRDIWMEAHAMLAEVDQLDLFEEPERD